MKRLILTIFSFLIYTFLVYANCSDFSHINRDEEDISFVHNHFENQKLNEFLSHAEIAVISSFEDIRCATTWLANTQNVSLNNKGVDITSCTNTNVVLTEGQSYPNESMQVTTVTLSPSSPKPGETVTVNVSWKANGCSSCIVKANVFGSWSTSSQLRTIHDGFNETKTATFTFTAPSTAGSYSLRLIWAFDIGAFSNYTGSNLPTSSQCSTWGNSISYVLNKSFSVSAVSPTLSANQATLNFGNVEINTNSTSQSYTLTGSYLTGNVTVTAPSQYQVSLSSTSGWASSVTVTPSSGSVNKTIYVSFSPISSVEYSGNISHTSSGAATKNVSVSGTGIEINSPSLAIGNINASSGNNVAIPVNAANLKNIAGFQFTIDYDATKLTYQSCSNWPANVSGVTVSNPKAGKITIVYGDLNNLVNITSGKFFDINFKVIAASGTALLSWSDDPTAKLLVNSNLESVNFSYTNGSVEIIPGQKLTGNLAYDNADKTPLISESISLTNISGQSAGNKTTDGTGSFSFDGLSNSTYTLKPVVTLPWGNSGVNVTDVLMYKQFIANSRTLSAFRERAGDVNGSGLPINVTDVLLIMRRLGDPSKTFPAGDWLFDNTTAVINNSSISGHNLSALCYGDANGSYVPTTNKSVSNIFVEVEKAVSINSNNKLEVPFWIDKSINNLAAVGLTFSYPDELFEVENIRMAVSNDDLYYTVIDGTIRIVYATLNAFDQDLKSPLFTISFTLKENADLYSWDKARPMFYGYGDFTDVSATEYKNVNVIYAGIDQDMIHGRKENGVRIYPNPAKSYVNMTNVENVEIFVYDVYGRLVINVMGNSDLFRLDLDGLKTGIYMISAKKDKGIFNEKITIIK